jgi:carboxypeptidase PM20D1
LKLFLKAFLGIMLIALCLGLLLVVNTLRFSPKEMPAIARAPLNADLGAAVLLLSEAVQIQTVSTDLTRPEFPAFVDFLERSFPRVHTTMNREILAASTPLLRWQGTDPDLSPVLLAAHYDVVPVEPATLDQWQHPPFSGVEADGSVWGRGTLDNKGAVIALLASAEHLIAEGFRPERTVYFSFGGDEEVGGQGAQAVRDYLIKNGIRPAWVLDEGSMVFEGAQWRVDKPVASINVAEKGYLTVALIARDVGGHSSSPPEITAAGRIARAVDKLQSAPFDSRLDGVVREQFQEIGPYYAFGERILMANLWLMSPILESILAGSNGSSAMLRTTIAPTMLAGSTKDNVLPTQASATINFRIHPRDTIDSVLAHVSAAIDDPNVEINIDQTTAIEASPVSNRDTKGFKDIESALRSVFGDIIVAPGLSIGATDARFYAQAADASYRINPFLVSENERAGFHGPNERLSIENLEAAIDFYGVLLQMQ